MHPAQNQRGLRVGMSCGAARHLHLRDGWSNAARLECRVIFGRDGNCGCSMLTPGLRNILFELDMRDWPRFEDRAAV